MSAPFKRAQVIEFWFDAETVSGALSGGGPAAPASGPDAKTSQASEVASTHFQSRYLGENEEGFFVELPVDPALIERLRPGCHLTVVVSLDSGLHLFSTRVIGMDPRLLKRLYLQVPHQVARIQRRHAFRWQAPVPVRLLAAGRPQQEYVTRDLSTGGMLLAGPLPLDPGERVTLDFDLPDGAVGLEGRVLRCEHLDIPDEETAGSPRPWQLGIQFLDCSSETEDRITRFIFQEQRYRRKQGLM